MIGGGGERVALPYENTAPTKANETKGPRAKPTLGEVNPKRSSMPEKTFPRVRRRAPTKFRQRAALKGDNI